jgi:hypothetical protein
MNAPNSETVLITGASSGIGLELAKCFAADGCRLILLARNTEALEVLAGELRRTNKIETLVLTADLSRPETPARVFQELQGRGMTVDVLVNNAGFGANGLFAGLPLQRQLELLVELAEAVLVDARIEPLREREAHLGLGRREGRRPLDLELIERDALAIPQWRPELTFESLADLFEFRPEAVVADMAIQKDARLANGEKFRLREIHDLLARNANVPVALVRWEYLGLRDEIGLLWPANM